MAIAEVSIIPIGTGSPSVSLYVARAIGVLQGEKNVKYEMTSMGTIVEGDLDAILGVVKKMHQAVLDEGVMRVLTTVKIDDRRDKPLTSRGKIESVLKKLES